MADTVAAYARSKLRRARARTYGRVVWYRLDAACGAVGRSSTTAAVSSRFQIRGVQASAPFLPANRLPRYAPGLAPSVAYINHTSSSPLTYELLASMSATSSSVQLVKSMSSRALWMASRSSSRLSHASARGRIRHGFEVAVVVEPMWVVPRSGRRRTPGRREPLGVVSPELHTPDSDSMSSVASAQSNRAVPAGCPPAARSRALGRTSRIALSVSASSSSQTSGVSSTYYECRRLRRRLPSSVSTCRRIRSKCRASLNRSNSRSAIAVADGVDQGQRRRLAKAPAGHELLRLVASVQSHEPSHELMYGPARRAGPARVVRVPDVRRVGDDAGVSPRGRTRQNLPRSPWRTCLPWECPSVCVSCRPRRSRPAPFPYPCQVRPDSLRHTSSS